MKYILKKEYPGSPKLGFILNENWEVKYPLNCYLINRLIFNPNKHPEFWELVVEEYKILELSLQRSVKPEIIMTSNSSDDYIQALLNCNSNKKF